MRTCPQCQAEVSEDAIACSECQTALGTPATESRSSFADADYDPEDERERFEQRYGIDIGDRTVDEYLQHLSQQDYSLTIWIGMIVVTQIVGIGLFAFNLVTNLGMGVTLSYVFTAISVLMAVGIFGDTQAVGQFEPWAKIRWTYVLISALPLVGHIAAGLYLLLRRLKHEQTARYRRRLLNAGFDTNPDTNEGRTQRSSD